MERVFRSTLLVFLGLTLTTVPPLRGETAETKHKGDKISAEYAYLFTIVAPPGNHDPKEVAARNAKLFEDMKLTPQHGEVLASVASKYRDYVRLSNPKFKTAERESLPPIGLDEQVPLKPLSRKDQFFVFNLLGEYQDRVDYRGVDGVNDYRVKEIEPRVTIVYDDKD